MSEDYKVSRKLGKAFTLPTAPAFSFGGRYERASADLGPGPGQYGPLWGTNTKGTGFGTSSRTNWATNNGPAGTDYRPKTAQVLTQKPAFSFGGKAKPDSSANRVPGPGAYDSSPADKVVRPSASAFTMAPRIEPDKEAERKPAPGAYDPDYRPREVHTATIKFRNTAPSLEAGVPGPGEYDTRPRRSPSDGKTFGVGRSDRHLNNGVPGPGAYGVPHDPYRPRQSVWSIGRASRDAGSLANGVPGPGAYSAREPVIPRDGGHSVGSNSRSAPAYTFGGRPDSTRPPIGPGPADYGVPSDPGRNTKPAFSLRGAAVEDKREKVPGPGAYAADRADKVVRSSAPAISISWRSEDPGSKEVRPGPGAYDAKDVDGKIPVSIKFRNDVPPDFADNPAPHDYADKDFKGFGTCGATCGNTKGFTMGRRWRDDKREHVPGPQYRVGVSTLGVGAQSELDKSKLNLTVVL
ncbi:hypothetical protein HYH02_002715 [Chlamydomonas schloesseri]|uniref:Uncharacterized protein n=1 Tax=Chlamydomonas schloesseri TaxID=2026947 RepID=A0A835WTH8_9CHLO|nr:hypothetical protein HYH02_002715 [Chlamydomonas schloesseri]|eukprot:KAG2452476.1 hypothetical protein HYH02_002715 [Chlamydomonas schloesseri]